MYLNRTRAAWFLAVLAATAGARSVFAFAKKQSGPSAKMVVTLTPIQDVTIALPQAVIPSPTSSNAPTYDFGPNLHASLCQQLINTHFILSQPEQELCGSNPSPSPSPSALSLAEAVPSPGPSPEPSSPDVWDGSSVVPAATFSFTIDALAMRTGGHGDRMFYGFDERLRTPFNDGLNTEPNEFPLNLIEFQHWFDRTFQDRGTSPLDSQSGLDLGEGFNLNAVIAQAGIQYAIYNAVIRMHVTMDAPLVGRHEVKTVQVKGGGYFFDVVGGYEEWSGAIGLARSDAMKAAFNNAFAATYAVIDQWSQTLPFTAKIFDFQSATEIFLNTGPSSNIPVGTKYSPVGNPSVVIEVTESVPSGSVGKLDSGTLSQIQKGMILVQSQYAAPAQQKSVASDSPTPVASQSITIPNTNLPKSDFAGAGLQVQDPVWQSILDTVTGGPLLPYRIWRYFQYDQSFSVRTGKIAVRTARWTPAVRVIRLSLATRERIIRPKIILSRILRKARSLGQNA